MRVAVIGSGPTALACTWALLKVGITDLTILSRQNADEVPDDKSSYLPKSRFGQANIYLQDQYQPEWNLLESSAIGGFSTIWGSGFNLWGKEVFKLYSVSQDECLASAKDLLAKIPLIGSSENLLKNLAPHTLENPFEWLLPDSNKKLINNLQLQSPLLGVEVSGIRSCRSCNECLKGCPYGSIWSSEVPFLELRRKKKIEWIIGQVEVIRQNPDGISLQGESEILWKGDCVIVACGPVSSAKLLLRSNLEEEIQLNDSQTFFFVGVKLRSIRRIRKGNALSKKWIVDSNGQIFVSLYDLEMEMISHICKVLKSRFRVNPRSLIVPLRRFFFVGIGFLNSEAGGRLQVRNVNSKPHIFEEKPPKRLALVFSHLFKIFNFLIYYGLAVIPIPYMPRVGHGYHIGGNEEIWKKYGLHNISKRGLNGVFVGDSLNLSVIPPGPHTFNTMCISYSHISRFVV